jgi:hypothetical protein
VKITRLRSRWFWLLFCTAVLVLAAAYFWLWFVFRNSGNSDSCHVIALNLADAKVLRPQGRVAREEIEALGTQLTRASVITTYGDGAQDSFGGEIRAEVKGNKLKCWTEGTVFGWGAVTHTVDMKVPLSE